MESLERKKVYAIVIIGLILVSGAAATLFLSESKDDYMSVKAFAEVNASAYGEGEAVSITLTPNSTRYDFRVSGNLGIFRIPDEVNPTSLVGNSNLRAEVKNYDVSSGTFFSRIPFKDFTHDCGNKTIVWNGTVLASNGLLFNSTSTAPIYVNAPRGYYFAYPLEDHYYDRRAKHVVHFTLTERSIFYYDGLEFKVSRNVTGSGIEYTMFIDNSHSTAKALQCHIEGRIYYAHDGDRISEGFSLQPGANATFRMGCGLPFFDQGNGLSTMALVKTSAGDYYFREYISHNTRGPSWEAGG